MSLQKKFLIIFLKFIDQHIIVVEDDLDRGTLSIKS